MVFLFLQKLILFEKQECSFEICIFRPTFSDCFQALIDLSKGEKL